MSRPEHRADEPDDATSELPQVPELDSSADPLDPASLAWSAEPGAVPGPPPAGPPDRHDPGAPLSELSDVSFPTAWRGYEPTAVDAYVRQVTRTIADLEGNRSPAEAVRRALDRVGEETASILQAAEQTAERMTEKSRQQASERLERAEREADEITLAARTRLRQLDGDVDRIWLERQRLIDDTRGLAARLGQIADQAEERFPAEDEDTTASEETTVSDVRRALRGGDTVRFSPPGMSESDAPDAEDGFSSLSASDLRRGSEAREGPPADQPAESLWSTPDPSPRAEAAEPASGAAPEAAGMQDTDEPPADQPTSGEHDWLGTGSPEVGSPGSSAPEEKHGETQGAGLGEESPEPATGTRTPDEPIISWSTPETERRPDAHEPSDSHQDG